ncbi:MAG: enoyl-CoA hydratase/isomerase family protein [Acidobacteria bacterium]|nr:enoyl-CoA hydratase/isomerase family protein [Acidobacteriota bacterium]
MARKTITIEHSEGIATITLNRPEKRNAISYELISELLDALEETKQSGAAALIITGAGKAFCSGMDLDDLAAITSRTPEENLKDSETMARLFRAIYEFPRPAIADVNGPAIAGGCGIATMCDFTLAAEGAKFGYTEVRIGFVPAIVSTFLIWQVGEKRARDLLLTGRIIGAAEAHRLGLVNEILPAAELLPRARALAGEIMQNSPTSVAATKALLLGYVREALDRQVAQAVMDNARIRTTHDFREGIASFLEKRTPNWREA